MPEHRRYQTYGLDADKQLVHCGPHHATRCTTKIARKLHRKWLRWRAEYLRTHPGDYPLRTAPRVAWFGMQLLGEQVGQNECQWFAV